VNAVSVVRDFSYKLLRHSGTEEEKSPRISADFRGLFERGIRNSFNL